ncbi:MAG: glycoside hydrolase family 3 C-terminal domain-containing protein [Firmicutes bacterium]|nr:glycoside hydrolase family 3 C-terminal domain-containing protein [Bacillota bacterium]
MKNLLKQMSMKEKIGQLLQIPPFFFVKDLKIEVAGPVEELHLDEEKIFFAGSALGIGSAEEMIEVQRKYLEKSRHKIPLIFMADIIHGYKTIFPVPIAMASSFNPEIAYQCARISAKEASTSGIHVSFSPMADLSRDPRWGRVVEGFGEDPTLISSMVEQMVKGYIGDGIEKEGNIASCVKHFAGYGASEAGRDYNTVDISKISLYSQYLPAYRKALEAGSRMVMTSFNTLDGVPCTVNSFLLRDVLRNNWKSNAVTISDYDSLKQILAHGIAEDMKEVAYKGITGGLDIEMASSAYSNHLESLIDEGIVDERLLDEAVLRILELKRDLGLFDNPYKGASPEMAKTIVLSESNLQAARKAAHESMILLKNDGVLPLDSQAKIALLGPYSTSRRVVGPWSWHGRRDVHDTLEEVLNDNIIYVNCEEDPKKYTKEDIDRIKEADIVVLAIGEDEHLSGEAHSRSKIRIPGKQEQMFEMIHSLGMKSITLLFNGRPLILDQIQQSNALLECWFLGSESSSAIKDILFGTVNPSGKLPISFPRNEGQIPVYYNHLNTGRPYLGPNDYNEYVSKYLDIENTPMYAFGYGLSYSTFNYSDLNLSTNRMTETESITVSVTVKNDSNVEGDEISQLYIRDYVARVSRPVKELKHFQKNHFKEFQSKVIEFTITLDDLKYYLGTGDLVFDKGRFQVMVGTSSDSYLSDDFELI